MSTDGTASFAPDDMDSRRRQLEEIVSDETLPVLERQARLEALASEWGLASEVSSEEASDPFRQQIANALAMLADGGHRQAP